jgi:hypothetical protein
MKQWRDDVDRLLGMAHSASTRPRPRSSRCQHAASASVRSPSVRVAPTEDLRAELNRQRAGEDAPVCMERSNDLRAELNCKRAGEDAYVSLKRAREHRQNVEGRNLDYDFAAVAPQTPTGARIQAGVPLAGVGYEDHVSAERIVQLAKLYAVVEGHLYRRGANDLHMRCITQEEGRELRTEIHGGECGSHSSSRTLVGKAFWHGFY